MSTGTQSPRGLLPPHGADHHTVKVEVKDAVSNIAPVTKPPRLSHSDYRLLIYLTVTTAELPGNQWILKEVGIFFKLSDRLF